jgi:hypothetical protein
MSVDERVSYPLRGLYVLEEASVVVLRVVCKARRRHWLAPPLGDGWSHCRLCMGIYQINVTEDMT